MPTPRIGSLFSGAGGLDLAVEHVTGGRTVWHCEADPDASKVLAVHWPGVPNLGDITAVDWSQVEPVDVLCGGFPCQDVSAAGRRAGLAGGTRSGLWAEMARAIEALRPALVAIENVEGLLTADGEPWPPEVIAADDERSRWNRICRLIDSKIERAKREGWWDGQYRTRKKFEAARASRLRKRAVARFKSVHRRLVQRAIAVVVGTLATLGYDTQWDLVSAAEVGAPHRRKRIFITAHATGDRRHEGRAESAGFVRRPHAAIGGVPAATHSEGDGLSRVDGGTCGPEACGAGERQSTGSPWGAPGPVDLLPTPSAADGNGGGRYNSDGHQSTLPGTVRELLPTPGASDGSGGRSANVTGGVRSSGAKRSVPLTDLPLLLPTPLAQQSGNTPAEHLRKKPGRKKVTDLAILVEHGLMATGGELLPTPAARDYKGSNPNRAGGDDLPTALLPTPRRSDGDGGPNPLTRAERMDDVETRVIRLDGQWGKYAPAIQRWESILRPAPAPTQLSRNGNQRLNPAFPEWMIGYPLGWVTDIEISSNAQLRIIGNSVCPQQAIAALRWLFNVSELAA
ncbi:DNA cytosine methyltransferase [Mycobacterium sp. NPDC050853]|uniref:DNA cytosine methyltransferase n=1 Tax=Mycobacterium sp. NPDC050853 TaxID=3155160 RepID=UPI0033CEED74